MNVFPSTEPPHINGSDEPAELSVIVNNPLELLCISSGIPVPKISWMKDGRPLLQNDNVHVLREVLRITSAQVECLFQIGSVLQTLEECTELPAIRTILRDVLKSLCKIIHLPLWLENIFFKPCLGVSHPEQAVVL